MREVPVVGRGRSRASCIIHAPLGGTIIFEIMHAGIRVLISHFSFSHTQCWCFITWRGHRFSYSTSRKMHVPLEGWLDQGAQFVSAAKGQRLFKLAGRISCDQNIHPLVAFLPIDVRPLIFWRSNFGRCHVWSGTHNFSSVEFVIRIWHTFLPSK